MVSFIKNSDHIFLVILVVLILLGLLILYSASYQKQINTGKNFVLNQIVWIISGASLVFLIASTSYRYFLSVAYIIYGIHIFFLLLVLIIGKTALGAQRWISFGGIGFQPSEFSKVFTILVLARMIGDYPQRLTYIKGLVAPFCIVMLPMILIFKQPDLGTALVFFPIFLAIIWVGGIRLKYLMAMFASVIITMPLFWGLLKEYQKDRLLVFMNPNLDPLGAGYTINQSRIAIGSGMFFGKGWLTGTQNRLNFLPERHTDFIFSVIGEEWGFVGTATILFLFIFFMFRSIRIAESCGDVSGRLICVGITTMLSLHVIINIGMTLGVMPVVGMPLPFISYGGSAFIVNLIAVGFLLNVQNHKSCF